VIVAALMPACGDKANPVAPNPTVAGLVISGADYLLTGSATTYTATATLSDGTTRTVTPVWSSSAAAVATVDSAGRVDGRTHGATTLTAAHDGRSASKTVQVVNNYNGSWSGRYIVRACQDSGIFSDGFHTPISSDVPWCQDKVLGNGIGSEHAFVFRLSQTGGNYSEIRATFGANADGIPGTVTADGRLKLEGGLKLLDWYGDHWGDFQVIGWDTNLDGAGGMTGRWTQNTTAVGRPGMAHEEVEIVTMSRGTEKP
jgi:Big-like domain-containing protein